MQLEEIREHLDRLDSALLQILAERMSFIPKVAHYKMEHGLERYQPQREEELIKKKRQMAEEQGMNPYLAESIFREIIREAHRIEKRHMQEE